MIERRTRTVLALAVLSTLAAGCGDGDNGTGTCNAVFAGRVVAAAQPVANATVTLRDTVRVGGVPLITATSNAAGEFGAVLSGECLTCAASILPPQQYESLPGAPERVEAPLRCNETLQLNFTLQVKSTSVD
jgi:hypothetical protein